MRLQFWFSFFIPLNVIWLSRARILVHERWDWFSSLQILQQSILRIIPKLLYTSPERGVILEALDPTSRKLWEILIHSPPIFWRGISGNNHSSKTDFMTTADPKCWFHRQIHRASFLFLPMISENKLLKHFPIFSIYFIAIKTNAPQHLKRPSPSYP